MDEISGPNDSSWDSSGDDNLEQFIDAVSQFSERKESQREIEADNDDIDTKTDVLDRTKATKEVEKVKFPHLFVSDDEYDTSGIAEDQEKPQTQSSPGKVAGKVASPRKMQVIAVRTGPRLFRLPGSGLKEDPERIGDHLSDLNDTTGYEEADTSDDISGLIQQFASPKPYNPKGGNTFGSEMSQYRVRKAGNRRRTGPVHLERNSLPYYVTKFLSP
ncbi:DEKNAAC102113 [Brettanomyces naardenensis]|uniref:DEKNAAC102113 n=1 Tax=Brettanomyces naardenensis TaxID=13370 RepID=A0A448YJP2_BRENA|nr:DEKNAAC102113 [Brettanomyces naardenensis]